MPAYIDEKTLRELTDVGEVPLQEVYQLEVKTWQYILLVSQSLVDSEVGHILGGEIARQVIVDDTQGQPLGVILEAFLAVHQKEEVSDQFLVPWDLGQVPESLTSAVIDPGVLEQVFSHLDLEELSEPSVESFPQYFNYGLRR